ncbi:hypothetical protein COBT_000317 [Conglomerata obtusa]
MQVEQQIDNRQGTSQIISNIKLLDRLSSYLKTTLGPYGLDKLIVTGSKILITNDGATIMKSLNLNHPAAKLMKSISVSQDDEVGDGTTSVVLLTVEILKSLEEIIKKNNVMTVYEHIDNILVDCLNVIEENCIDIEDENNIESRKVYLQKLAKTALTSKVVKYDKDHFSKMIVDGLQEDTNIVIKKTKGGSCKDSFLFSGIAFEKCFTYAGYEQQPKFIENPLVLLTNIELEWKSERENAEMKIKNVEEYQNIVDAEWKIITDKLDFIVKTGAKVVLSNLAIGDYATQYFAKFGIFCAGRVNSNDINKIKECSGAQILSSLNDKGIDVNNFLGKFELFEEKQVGNFRYNFLHTKNSSTLILRGPGDEILNEMERSLNDAIMIVKKNMKTKLKIITGGGSNEMSISTELKKLAYNYSTEIMFVYLAIAEAFENYISILSSNFGLDSLLVISKLRVKHKEGEKYFGVLNDTGLIGDMFEMGVFEPLSVKRNIIINAFNAVKTILMIDSTIIVPVKQ